jgi:hypothetical protein
MVSNWKPNLSNEVNQLIQFAKPKKPLKQKNLKDHKSSIEIMEFLNLNSVVLML